MLKPIVAFVHKVLVTALRVVLGAVLVTLRVLRSPFWWLYNRLFELLDRHVLSWHRWGRILGIAHLLAFRNRLREKNLLAAESAQGPDPELPAERGPSYFRSADGAFTDAGTAGMGRVFAPFGRNMAPQNPARLDSPNPREVSRRLMTRRTFLPAKTLNLLAAAWIQFQVHDWFGHETDDERERRRIPLADDDPWPGDGSKPGGMEVPATRNVAARGCSTPVFRNINTHWWDASQLYGNDLETQRKLRDGGRLRIGRKGLPKKNGIDITGFNDNWWIGLSMFHTLFTLEHNAIHDRLEAEHPEWDDERLFQTARLVNAALIAKIQTLDWTPAILNHPTIHSAMSTNWWGILGKRLKKALGRVSSGEMSSGILGSPHDHHGVPYAMTEEFVSVYRMHPLLPDEFRFFSATTGEARENGGSFTLEAVQGRNTEALLKKLDYRFDDLFYSFGIAHPGQITLHNFPEFLQRLTKLDDENRANTFDVAAVDILRDRERGVPRYNAFRRALRLAPVKRFEDLTRNREWAEEIRHVYGNDIEKVDLMVGLLAETPPEGFGFSDTAFRIFVLMASRRLKSDRFFTEDFTPEVYSRVGFDWVHENDLRSVLLRHFPHLKDFIHPDNPFAPWTPRDGDEEIAKATWTESARYCLLYLLPHITQGVISRIPLAVRLWNGWLDIQKRAAAFGMKLQKAYPGRVRLRFPRALLILSSAGAQEVLERSPCPFSVDPSKRKAMSKFQPGALTLSEGAEWERRRALNWDALERGKRELGSHFLDIVWREVAAAVPERRPIRWRHLEELFGKIALQVVLGTDARTDGDVLRRLHRMRRRANWFFLPGRSAELDGFHRRVLEYLSRAQPPSLVSLIADPADPDDVRADKARQIPHWLFAIAETVPANLAAGLALVCAHGIVNARVRTELGRERPPGREWDAASIDRLAYLEGCLHEAMRLWPTTPMLARRMAADHDVNEEVWARARIPHGTRVILPTALLHRDADDEKHFDPERWTRRRPPEGYFHFSAGPQECAGKDLALLLGKAAAAMLLERAEYRLASPALDEQEPPPASFDYFRLRLVPK